MRDFPFGKIMRDLGKDEFSFVTGMMFLYFNREDLDSEFVMPINRILQIFNIRKRGFEKLIRSVSNVLNVQKMCKNLVSIKPITCPVANDYLPPLNDYLGVDNDYLDELTIIYAPTRYIENILYNTHTNKSYSYYKKHSLSSLYPSSKKLPKKNPKKRVSSEISGKGIVSSDKSSSPRASDPVGSNAHVSSGELFSLEKMESRETLPKKSQATLRFEERFDRFWRVYPRKVGKARAKQAWMKLKPSEKTTVDAIKHVKASINYDLAWKELSYIPHGSTYVNQQRWLDQVAGRKDIDEFNEEGVFKGHV